MIPSHVYISYLKRSWCWSRRWLGFQRCKDHDCKEPWLQSAMTAKKNDCKEWPRTTMTTRKDDCKNNDCKKAMTAKNSQCKEQLWKEVSHKCFVFTTSTCSVWRKSGTRASYSKLQLAVFDGILARRLRLHNFNLQVLTEVSHKSFVCTTSLCRFWRKSCMKASFLHLQLAARSRGEDVPEHRPEPWHKSLCFHFT